MLVIPAPQRRTLFISHKRTILAILFVFLYSVSISLAVPPTTKYQPGATLDPACAPGDTNCSIQVLPTQTGNANTYLTTDGSDTAWSANTLVLGGNFTTTGAYATTLTTTGTTALTLPTSGTLATLAGVETLSNKTLTAPNIGAATGTSLDLASGAITSGLINGQTISSSANFTGSVTGGAASFTTGSFSGALTGTSATFSGDVKLAATFAGGLQYKEIKLGVNSGSQLGTGAKIRLGFDDLGLDAKSHLSFWTSPTATSAATSDVSIERMRINGGGNIGIGTTDPQNLLQLHGNAVIRLTNAITGSGNSDGLYIGNADATSPSFDIWNYEIGSIRLATSSTERFTIDSSGNIIVSDLAGSGNRCLYADSTGQINVKGFDCGSASGGDNLGDHTATQNIVLGSNWLSGDGGNEGLRVDASGNVGVGVVPASAKFEISGTADALRLSGASNPQLRFMTNSADVAARNFGISINQSLAGDFVLRQSSSNSADPILGTTRFSISTSGDVLLNQTTGSVGIGTTTPGYKLDVAGNVALAGDLIDSRSSLGALVIRGTNADRKLTINTNGSGVSLEAHGSATNDLFLGSDTGSGYQALMVQGSTGYVGIGTASPAVALHVKSADGGSISMENTASVISGSRGSLSWYNSSTSTVATIRATAVTDNVGTNLDFYTRPAGGSLTQTMTILGNGNVGIGTTAPANNLSIYPTTSTTIGTGLRINRNTLENQQYVDINYSGGSANFTAVNTLGTGGYIAFNRSNNGTTFDTSMSIDNNGNVGIGTTGPGAKLEVYDATDARIKIRGISASDAELNFQTASNGRGIYVDESDSNKLKIYTGAGKGLAGEVVIDNSGNVGIGTTTPTGSLSIAGIMSSWSANNYGKQIIISTTGNSNHPGIGIYDYTGANPWGIHNTSGAMNFSEMPAITDSTTAPNIRLVLKAGGAIQFKAYGAGTLVTDSLGNITASSDERLKDIEANFQLGLDAIRGLTPILYKWNTLSGMEMQSTYAGFSAQNVRDFIPEAIDVDPRGYYSLQDRPIMATMVNAIKELDIKVQSLPEFEDETFAAKVAEFLSGIAKGIANVELVNTQKVQTDELCVKDICVTRDQLMEMLQNTGSSYSSNNGGLSEGSVQETVLVEEPLPEEVLAPESSTTLTVENTEQVTVLNDSVIEPLP